MKFLSSHSPIDGMPSKDAMIDSISDPTKLPEDIEI